jgi:hypothetical protein
MQKDHDPQIPQQHSTIVQDCSWGDPDHAELGARLQPLWNSGCSSRGAHELGRDLQVDQHSSHIRSTTGTIYLLCRLENTAWQIEFRSADLRGGPILGHLSLDGRDCPKKRKSHSVKKTRARENFEVGAGHKSLAGRIGSAS